MTYIKYIIGALVVTLAVIIGIFVGSALVGDTKAPVGGSTSDDWNVGGALNVTGATTLTGDGRINGGTLNVATSNTATSTIIGGCFQFYATSTATALNFQASTTPGVMYSQYGSCPNL